MDKKPMGKTGFKVAPLAFGGNVFGWTADEKTSFYLLDAFVDAGFNLIDTADVYSHWAPGNQGGESETIIGNWLKKSGKRQHIIIATKVGGAMGPGKKDLSRNYILKAAEASLQRLQTDTIDLYQSHWDDEETPVEETAEAFAQLVREGKVRALGASNISPERLRQSLTYCEENNLPRYQTLQPEYNLYDRQMYEQQYQPLVQEKGLAVLNYFSLASGFLTGKYRSPQDALKSTRGEGIVKKYLNPRGLRIVAALDSVAQQNNTTPATVALAWLLTRPGIVAPIASATSVAQLQDLLKAATLQLGAPAIDALNKASAY